MPKAHKSQPDAGGLARLLPLGNIVQLLALMAASILVCSALQARSSASIRVSIKVRSRPRYTDVRHKVKRADSVAKRSEDSSSLPTPLSVPSVLARAQGGPNSSSIFMPAAIHGQVAKAGHVNLINFHTSIREERVAHANAWVTSWMKSRNSTVGDPGKPAPPLPPEAPRVLRPGCQVFVNHRYKFLYIWIPKTGSTSLRSKLSKCNGKNARPACLTALSRDMPREELARLFSTYYAFSVVRNPLKRALSSYKFLVSRMRDGCTQGVSWDAFCADPTTLGAHCLSQPNCCTWPPDFFWDHYGAQTRCLLVGAGPGEAAVAAGSRLGQQNSSLGSRGWAVDFLVRAEQLQEDMEELYREIDRRRDPGLPSLADLMASVPSPRARVSLGCGKNGTRLMPYPEVERNTSYMAAVHSEQYCDDADFFSPAHHPHCVRNLAHFYRRDIKLLYGGDAGMGLT